MTYLDALSVVVYNLMVIKKFTSYKKEKKSQIELGKNNERTFDLKIFHQILTFISKQFDQNLFMIVNTNEVNFIK